MIYGFFSFMVIALLLSMFAGYILAKRTQKSSSVILGAISTNAILIAITGYW